MVKLLWTREADPGSTTSTGRRTWCSYRAALDAAGAGAGDPRPASPASRSGGQQHALRRRPLPARGRRRHGAGGIRPRAALCGYVEVGLPVPIGFWRSVAASHNGFFAESFVDELAHARAPRSVRVPAQRWLAAHPRHRAVLELAARQAGWDRPPAPGARGIAMNAGFGGICAGGGRSRCAGGASSIEQRHGRLRLWPGDRPGHRRTAAGRRSVRHGRSAARRRRDRARWRADQLPPAAGAADQRGAPHRRAPAAGFGSGRWGRRGAGIATARAGAGRMQSSRPRGQRLRRLPLKPEGLTLGWAHPPPSVVDRRPGQFAGITPAGETQPALPAGCEL